MRKQMTENKKRKTEAGFAVNKSVFVSRWCNVNVAIIKTNC